MSSNSNVIRSPIGNTGPTGPTESLGQSIQIPLHVRTELVRVNEIIEPTGSGISNIPLTLTNPLYVHTGPIRVSEIIKPTKEQNIIVEKAGENDKACVICLENKANCIVWPCAHMNYCGDCGKKLENCAVCRGEITGFKMVYS